MTDASKPFTLLREQHIASLNICVQEFEHRKTGAQHIHLKSDSEENVFLVALKTVPHDSSGVAHILEHTALCGSERYPVRDPFFMMTRRSLNTFMNAFTSSDWTAYPFASLNKKDFHNLLDVYLDAVFFSRLDKLDFAQEGHRLEFSEMENPNSELEFKGVVYNEMKGAMSSVNSQLWQSLSKYLFPTSTYHFNSGGEPDCIPDLSYEQLLEFYRTHYHPSNAIFMSFGSIGADELQQKFEQQVLKRFERLDTQIEVSDEKRYHAPVRVQEAYANDESDSDNKHHVVQAWLLGKSCELDSLLKAQLLSSVLLDHSASPLMHVLESSELGSAPSPLCGLDDSQKEMTFVCGLSGAQGDSADDIEQQIHDCLARVARDGVPQEDIEAALHQLELQQREIGGDSYPYGLQLILKALNSANHGGDPANLLDLDGALAQLREQIQDTNFIPNLIRELLLDNAHSVRLHLSPDAKMAQRQIDAEKQRLAKIKASLSERESQAIIEQSIALKQRQESVDDPGSLPKVGLEDVPEQESHVSAEPKLIGGVNFSHYHTGTNGLVYQQAIYQLPALNRELLNQLSLYGHCVGELGAGDKNYLDMQRWQNAVSGGISAFSSIRGGSLNTNELSSFFVYSGKALERNHEALSELMQSIISSARFEEHSRISEIIAQLSIGMEQSVTGNGHALAMSAAAAGLSVPASLNHSYSGLEAIARMKALREKSADADTMATIGENLAKLHSQLSSNLTHVLLIGDQTLATPEQLFEQQPHSTNDQFQLSDFQFELRQQAWLCNTQVNFCARAYPTVSMAHEDAAALVVLGNYLRNGYLHKAIREQGGAYGGGASQDSNAACFRFYSYRDPRMADTLADFDNSISWLQNNSADHDKLEEAILGTISAVDRSESPAGRAKRCFHSELHGRSLELRQQYRKRILATSYDDLVRVSQLYLTKDKASTAVVCGRTEEQQAQGLGLELVEL
ncbi:insulinase family protein [Agaribacterium haliotis]|uniref:insulinase family protein n=1 Tax=Agaribacterium haliotis TaxID=2013869 RepID=UPI000BB52EC4|nr:insulinase family protein [Agaribacterium haliotis]